MYQLSWEVIYTIMYRFSYIIYLYSYIIIISMY